MRHQGEIFWVNEAAINFLYEDNSGLSSSYLGVSNWDEIKYFKPLTGKLMDLLFK